VRRGRAFRLSSLLKSSPLVIGISSSVSSSSTDHGCPSSSPTSVSVVTLPRLFLLGLLPVAGPPLAACDPEPLPGGTAAGAPLPTLAPAPAPDPATAMAAAFAAVRDAMAALLREGRPRFGFPAPPLLPAGAPAPLLLARPPPRICPRMGPSRACTDVPVPPVLPPGACPTAPSPDGPAAPGSGCPTFGDAGGATPGAAPLLGLKGMRRCRGGGGAGG
jgi:hypothetical protein